MAVKLKSQTKALFEKAFPERQIYHRSGGSVRYVSISPWRQAVMAGAATLVVGWCMFATVAVLLRGPSHDSSLGVGDRRVARLERDCVHAPRRQKPSPCPCSSNGPTTSRNDIKEAEQRHQTLKNPLRQPAGSGRRRRHRPQRRQSADPCWSIPRSRRQTPARAGRANTFVAANDVGRLPGPNSINSGPSKCLFWMPPRTRPSSAPNGLAASRLDRRQPSHA